MKFSDERNKDLAHCAQSMHGTNPLNRSVTSSWTAGRNIRRVAVEAMILASKVCNLDVKFCGRHMAFSSSYVSKFSFVPCALQLSIRSAAFLPTVLPMKRSNFFMYSKNRTLIIQVFEFAWNSDLSYWTIFFIKPLGLNYFPINISFTSSEPSELRQSRTIIRFSHSFSREAVTHQNHVRNPFCLF